jgi:hypothetical protein
VRRLPVGHNSEKRHRKDLNRIESHFAEAKEHHDKASTSVGEQPPPNLTWSFLAMSRMPLKSCLIKIERFKKRQSFMKWATSSSAKRIAKVSPISDFLMKQSRNF